ncbi:AsmA family protein [Zophobihabitans entericus]|uniref:AsmA family protein n=1 Tax=Zophobihabitans entericus TaxID=1635327 RepID=A0A6G9I910_9GAMM|nr:AsmA family protein [Zophobihabitans entericus]QIQ20703.1 AsmA family protein [Zophobihabitans entericus]
MRHLKQCLILLIAIIWFMILIPYFLLQTSFGANFVADSLLSQQSPYQFLIKNIDHSFANPYEITLNNVSILDKESQQHLLLAGKVVLALNKSNPLQLKSFDYILIKDGIINYPQTIKATEAIQANLLQLLNVEVMFQDEHTLSMQRVNGGIKPWSLGELIDRNKDFQFHFTIESLTLDQFTTQSVVIEGLQKNQTVFFNSFGGNINKGFFTSKARYLPDNSWLIDELQLNHLNLQTSLSLQELQNVTSHWPKMNINYLALLNSTLDSPELKIERANLVVRRLQHNEDKWQLNNGNITFNADNLVWQEELFTQPVIQLSGQDQRLNIDKLITSWQKGIINLSGQWQDNQLSLDQVAIMGINYTLPESWQTYLSDHKLPDTLQTINIKNFRVMPSILIDIQPEFPMQYTYLEASGNNLQLAANNQWGLWQGKLSLKAEHSTVNTVTLRHMAASLDIQEPKGDTTPDILVSMNALTTDGLLDASGKINLAENKVSNAELSGYSVDPVLLSRWKLIDNPPSDNNFILRVDGQISPLNLNGTLALKQLNRTLLYQVKQNHRVTN